MNEVDNYLKAYNTHILSRAGLEVVESAGRRYPFGFYGFLPEVISDAKERSRRDNVACAEAEKVLQAAAKKVYFFSCQEWDSLMVRYIGPNGGRVVRARDSDIRGWRYPLYHHKRRDLFSSGYLGEATEDEGCRAYVLLKVFKLTDCRTRDRGKALSAWDAWANGSPADWLPYIEDNSVEELVKRWAA